jgi:hypothetical protein
MHIGDGLFLCFFENGETVNICGDFYVGIYLNSPGWDKLPPMYHLNENHEPPYNFPQRAFKLRTLDNEMREYVSNRFIPMLFPIIEPPCPEVDSVRVMVDSTGCLVAEWDSLPYQEQWVVHYEGPGMSITDTVNRCQWRYNVIDTTSYTIYVRSRCTNLRSYSWSGWSISGTSPTDTTAIDTTAAIPTSHLSPLTSHLTIRPNPASDEVTLLSSFGITAVEAYNAAGTLVFSSRDSGSFHRLSDHALSLDLSSWPRGSYLLRIHTPAGTTTKKLLVQ